MFRFCVTNELISNCKPASLTINTTAILLAAHMFICVVFMIVSYVFINFFLSKKHSIEVSMAEKNNPSKNMISLKTLMAGGSMGFAILMVIIYFPLKQQSFPIGAVFTSLLICSANSYYASKDHILEYFLAKIKRQESSLACLVLVVRIPAQFSNFFQRSNQINVIG